MAQKIKVLIAEDNAADAELLLRALRQTGFDPEHRRVDSEAAYLAALDESLDLICSDYDMPQFNALRALSLLRTSGLQIPFIIVSGTIGEETAVDAMRLGATDYLLKDRLGRLGPAIKHALEQGQLRRERLKAEAALKESEQRFRQLTESIREVFWLSAPEERRILYVSPAYATIWQRPCESLLAQPASWLEMVHADDRARVAATWSGCASGDYDEEYRVLRPDGSPRWVREQAYPVRDDAGQVCRIAGVIEDVTERKQLESQFLRAQRMEAIGTLAGGIAHDLNNILAPILMSVGILRDKVSEAHDRDLLNMLESSARRGADIIKQLLTFSRGVEADGERGAVEARRVLKEIGGLIRETFPREISFVYHVGEDLWPVIADATQLHQVLVNLAVNARDAMPAGGTLTLKAQNVTIGQAHLAGRTDVEPGPYVEVTISDTGTGIPAPIMERIFDPFFTTKPVGKGTGLGLSTVLGIVRSHGGFLTVKSEPSRGTVFQVYWPAGLNRVGEEAPGLTLPEVRGRGELVLVVDDEPAIRHATEKLLQQHGFRVRTADSGQSAIDVVLQHPSEIKLVITDLMMPGMGGAALVRAIRVFEPAIRVMATSGLQTPETQESFAELGIAQVLAKPFESRVLLEAVRRELSMHGSRPPFVSRA